MYALSIVRTETRRHAPDLVKFLDAHAPNWAVDVESDEHRMRHTRHWSRSTWPLARRGLTPVSATFVSRRVGAHAQSRLHRHALARSRRVTFVEMPRARNLVPLALVTTLACSATGLLYPGDELEESRMGYGLVIIGAGPTVQIYTLEVCDRADTCFIVGPFMQRQEAYVMRLPVGEQCLTEVNVKITGNVDGGGSGIGYVFRSQDDCFRVGEGQLSYIGSFHAAHKGLRVEHHADIRDAVIASYPGLASATIDVQTSVD
jgi:hypothetical protein